MIARLSYLTLLALALAAAGCDSADPVATVAVTYRVSGFSDFSAAAATTVEWTDADGQRQTETDVALPWTRSAELPSGTLAYLGAAAESPTGAVGLRLEIEADGVTVAEREEEGTASTIGTITSEISASTTVTAE